MTADSAPTPADDAVAPEAQAWHRLSETARDAGDRAFCVVFSVAVLVALLLGAAWVYAMPSFR